MQQPEQGLSRWRARHSSKNVGELSSRASAEATVEEDLVLASVVELGGAPDWLRFLRL